MAECNCAERQHDYGKHRSESTKWRRFRDSTAGLCLYARRGSNPGPARLGAESDILTHFGERPVLYPDVRRIDAAKLFGVFDGAICQSAIEQSVEHRAMVGDRRSETRDKTCA